MPTSGKRIRDIGEFKLIDVLTAVVAGSQPGRLSLGIGDDAAVWRPSPGRHIVMSTDTMIEEEHFRLEWGDWKSLGHKALAVNLSDLAAMGARPRLALVSIGLTGSERDREIADLYRGMVALGDQFKTAVVGGDTTTSETAVMISITVLGEATSGPDSVMKRSSAREGDLIAVTGPLGLAAGGLEVLDQELRTLDGGPAMEEAFLRPKPRVREGRILARSGVRCAIDLSDGLLGDLPKVCSQSGLSAEIDELKIPVPLSIKWAFQDWIEVALRGGEDYELLFTASPSVLARINRNFRRAGLRLPTVIGRMVDPGEAEPEVRLRMPSGKIEKLEPGAYAHWG
ncbi:MAG: thiamine-phosphate kinase [Sphaerobacteraceae bacterium]|nr:MAG: thiamine-phosphate kinase [Sphaerobacteraceae bacterium]